MVEPETGVVCTADFTLTGMQSANAVHVGASCPFGLSLAFGFLHDPADESMLNAETAFHAQPLHGTRWHFQAAESSARQLGVCAASGTELTPHARGATSMVTQMTCQDCTARTVTRQEFIGGQGPTVAKTGVKRDNRGSLLTPELQFMVNSSHVQPHAITAACRRASFACAQPSYTTQALTRQPSPGNKLLRKL